MSTFNSPNSKIKYSIAIAAVYECRKKTQNYCTPLPMAFLLPPLIVIQLFSQTPKFPSQARYSIVTWQHRER